MYPEIDHLSEEGFSDGSAVADDKGDLLSPLGTLVGEKGGSTQEGKQGLHHLF